MSTKIRQLFLQFQSRRLRFDEPTLGAETINVLHRLDPESMKKTFYPHLVQWLKHLTTPELRSHIHFWNGVKDSVEIGTNLRSTKYQY